jgi:hypothetical protein
MNDDEIFGEEAAKFISEHGKDYNNPWIFNDILFKTEHISSFPKKLEGFVYLITNLLDGRQYIGKKSFWSRRKKYKATRRTTEESNWKFYYGSSESLKEDVKKLGCINFKREILYLCQYKKSMTLLEAREQFIREVIFHPEQYYNMNILGKFFFKDGKIVTCDYFFNRPQKVKKDKKDYDYSYITPEWRETIRQITSNRSEETKKKMSLSKIGRKQPHTSEWTKKIIESRSKNKNTKFYKNEVIIM